MWAFIRKCFIGGLLVWLPILATVWVIKVIISLMDSPLSLLPYDYQIPGLGVVLAIIVLFFTGLFVGNFFGRKIVRFGEYLVHRIPGVRTVYSAVKQVLETVLVPSGQSFRQVLLVKFPHQDSWTIAFLVGQGVQEVNALLNQELITVFVPTTPNPTSGYIVMVKKEDVKELKMSVDEALRFVISLGVVQPKKIGEI